MAPLAEAGLIRQRKLGTFVARPRIHSVVLDIPDIPAEVTARGEPYAHDLLARDVRCARGGDLGRLDAAQPVEVFALRCLHRASQRHFALEERLINLETVPEARDVDFAATAPGSWLLGHVTWTEAEHRINAANPSKAAAALLTLELTVACLVMERGTWRGQTASPMSGVPSRAMPMTWWRGLRRKVRAARRRRSCALGSGRPNLSGGGGVEAREFRDHLRAEFNRVAAQDPGHRQELEQVDPALASLDARHVRVRLPERLGKRPLREPGAAARPQEHRTGPRIVCAEDRVRAASEGHPRVSGEAGRGRPASARAAGARRSPPVARPRGSDPGP